MNTFSISHIYALTLQLIISLQIIKTFVESDEEYEIKNILKKRMISEKAHYFIK